MVNVIERNTCRGERSVIHYQGPRDGQNEGYDECIGQSDPQVCYNFIYCQKA